MFNPRGGYPPISRVWDRGNIKIAARREFASSGEKKNIKVGDILGKKTPSGKSQLPVSDLDGEINDLTEFGSDLTIDDDGSEVWNTLMK